MILKEILQPVEMGGGNLVFSVLCRLMFCGLASFKIQWFLAISITLFFLSFAIDPNKIKTLQEITFKLF